MVKPRKRPRPKSRKRKEARPLPPGDEIPDTFSGLPGVLLATGPSLTHEDIEYIRPLHRLGKIAVFGLNDAYKWCDFLDVFYFCDPRWLVCNPEAIDYPHGQIWTQDQKIRGSKEHREKIKRCAGSSGTGINKKPNLIHFGGNSGFQLLNLAWHFGTRQFYLLGYNMGASLKGDGRQHMFGSHPKPLNQTNNYRGFVSSFRAMHISDRRLVTNCTYPSALADCFVQRPLKECFPHDEEIRPVRFKESAPPLLGTTRPSKKAARDAARREASGPQVCRRYGGPDCNGSKLVATTTEPDTRPAYGGRRSNLRD